jgi:hypothetical protein
MGRPPLPHVCRQCDKPPADNIILILCKLHYRIWLMRRAARENEKYEPTVKELEELINNLDDMKCPNCGQKMAWFKSEGICITLQHNRNGTVQILCATCNASHGNYKDDSFYDQARFTEDYKTCPKCKMAKPHSAYYKRAGCRFGLSTYCKDCSKELSRETHHKKRKLT